jgi:hypothetical protein
MSREKESNNGILWMSRKKEYSLTVSKRPFDKKLADDLTKYGFKINIPGPVWPMGERNMVLCGLWKNESLIPGPVRPARK